ncbi:hypothetical protein CLOSYM_02665 [[Clostridium] symbiosum ATCC 14940]|uniref:Uncharacterized protein n=1 Tax=[Clostridium] symbiosum ATCC 14940 TaxID=411472 RepID=A0ABC9TWU0_CLOSY|nr:hypothetical protein CLOSYM_02665 [[Clostridium] symbiosum ATCC 14940]
MNTLAFGYILPTTRRIPDFHRLETCAAGRTVKGRLKKHRFCFFSLPFYPPAASLSEKIKAL